MIPDKDGRVDAGWIVIAALFGWTAGLILGAVMFQ